MASVAVQNTLPWKDTWTFPGLARVNLSARTTGIVLALSNETQNPDGTEGRGGGVDPTHGFCVMRSAARAFPLRIDNAKQSGSNIIRNSISSQSPRSKRRLPR